MYCTVHIDSISLSSPLTLILSLSLPLSLLPSPSLPLQYDDLAMLPIPAKLCVHSASTLGRQDINSGDKIILSPQVLMSCEQQELSYPIVSMESLEWNMGMELTVLNLLQRMER